MESSSDRFCALMVTDGAITNADETLKKIQDLIEKGNYFTLIHVGTENGFTQKIREMYGEDAVKVIDSPDKLTGLTLGYTKNIYGMVSWEKIN